MDPPVSSSPRTASFRGDDPMPRLRQRLSSPRRVESFSDAVFAISATLLVLDLGIPRDHYLTRILSDWPGFVAYLAAFLTIASIWLHHHTLFSRIHRIDAGLVVTNLGLLLGVAVLPWPTALLAASLRDGDRDDQVVAVAVYGIVSLVVAGSWAALSGTLSRRPGLLQSAADQFWMRANFRTVLWTTLPVVAAVPLAIVAPVGSLGLYVAVPIFFLVLSSRPTEPDTDISHSG